MAVEVIHRYKCDYCGVVETEVWQEARAGYSMSELSATAAPNEWKWVWVSGAYEPRLVCPQHSVIVKDRQDAT